MKNLLFAVSALVFLTACEPAENGADAYGNFEAREVLVSAEATGKLIHFAVEEGDRLSAGQVVGIVDTTQLHLKKLQLQASIEAINDKLKDPTPQIEVLEEKLANLQREKKRFESLLADGAATPKQVDDLNGQVEVVRRQIDAARRDTRTLNEGILAEVAPLRVQVRQIDDQLRKSYIVNPIDGTVLVKLAEPAEFTAAGKPLYKIADLDEMTLRIYVSGEQLPHLRIGQEVAVFIDEDETTNRKMTGTITWIAGQAEFTPKIVQTKEERVNLVYAVKVSVKNDGSLKIGMPGEVRFQDGPSLAADPSVE